MWLPFVSAQGRENRPGVAYPAAARWNACEKLGRYIAVGAAAAAATAAATDDGGADPFNKLGLKSQEFFSNIEMDIFQFLGSSVSIECEKDSFTH